MKDRGVDSVPSRQAGRRYILKAGLGIAALPLLVACEASGPVPSRRISTGTQVAFRHEALDSRLTEPKTAIDLVPKGYSYASDAVMRANMAEFFNGQNPFDPSQGNLVILSAESAAQADKASVTGSDLFKNNGDSLGVVAYTEGRGAKLLGRMLVTQENAGLLALSIHYRTFSRGQSAREAAIEGVTLYLERAGKVSGYTVKQKDPKQA